MDNIFEDERILKYYQKRIKCKRYINRTNEISLVINDLLRMSNVSYTSMLTEDQALKFFFKGEKTEINIHEETFLDITIEYFQFISNKIKNYFKNKYTKGELNV